MRTETLHTLYSEASAVVEALAGLARAGDEDAAKLLEPALKSLQAMEDQFRGELKAG